MIIWMSSAPVAALAGELDQPPDLSENGPALRRSGDGDSAAAAELHQSLVREHVQRAQHASAQRGASRSQHRDTSLRWPGRGN